MRLLKLALFSRSRRTGDQSPTLKFSWRKSAAPKVTLSGARKWLAVLKSATEEAIKSANSRLLASMPSVKTLFTVTEFAASLALFRSKTPYGLTHRDNVRLAPKPVPARRLSRQLFAPATSLTAPSPTSSLCRVPRFQPTSVTVTLSVRCR